MAGHGGGPQTAWIVTGGHAGHREPCIGVAERLGLDARIIDVAPPFAYAALAPWGPAAPHPLVTPPWPDLVLASGRQAIPYARAIRRRSRGRSFIAVLQNPVVPAAWFDFVWVNEHDRLSGPNVARTLSTPNRVTAAMLTSAADALRRRVAPLERPFAGVLVGGTSSAYRFGPEEAARLGHDLRAFAARHHVSLLLTPSRRTGTDNAAVLRDALGDAPAWLWDGEGDNPYLGILGLSDTLIATADSVNMLGEAAATGTPLYAWRLPGDGAKHDRFHKALAATGAMRWFDGDLERWTYTPINATETVAGEILARWRARADRARAD